MKSGFVSIVGRPNAGKSTIINALLERKLSIVTEKAQTTRNSIKGIYDDGEYQIIFIDTPGIHKAAHSLGKFMNKEALDSAKDVDANILVVDASRKFDAGDEFIRAAGKCIVTSLNGIGKVYRIGGDEFIAVINSTPAKMSEFLEMLDETTAAWKGSIDVTLSISKGYSETRDVVALKQETGRERLDKMAKIADRRMYEDKKAYYERTGKDRRR